MKHRPGTTWWDLAEELDILICDAGPAGCRKKWTSWTHTKGRVDPAGVLHWSGFNRRTTRNGLYRFLIWAAYCRNREFRNEPAWLGLYHAHLWAFYTARDTFSYRVPWEHTVGNRLKVKKLARKGGVTLRPHHNEVFWWANWKPERAKMGASGGAMDG